jgi:2-dehydropantoate 2-reductase
MKILVVGAGAIGTLFGVKLKKAGHDVNFLVKNNSIVSTLRSNGFSLIEKGERETVNCPVFSTDNIPHRDFDLILLAVKAPDTEGAILSLRGIETKYLLALQNGMGQQEIIRDYFGEDRILIGVTGEGALYISPGVVEHTGRGETVVTSYKDESGAIHVAEIFKGAGFKTLVENNVEYVLWGKLIINSAINPISALTGRRNGELLKSVELLGLMREILKEGILVANSIGIELPYTPFLNRLEEILKKTALNKSSMLQDIERKRKTEIDYINGYILKRAKEKNIDVPLNRAFYILIKALEKHIVMGG